MDRIGNAICDIDETEAELVFTMDANRRIDQNLERSFPEKNTRRSRELSAAVQGEDVRLLIQECLQQQPSKRWQVITLRYRDLMHGESYIDTVVLHHYYSSSKKGEIKYGTEVLRLGPNLAKKDQTLALQDMMIAADRYLKQTFDELGFSYGSYKSPVTEKDYREMKRFLESQMALIRPTGGKSIREMYDPSVTFDMVQEDFRDVVLYNTLVSIVDSFQRMKDVQSRVLHIFREKPQVYILMLYEMFSNRQRPFQSTSARIESRESEVKDPFGSIYEVSPITKQDNEEVESEMESEAETIKSSRMNVRDPITNRCMINGGPTYNEHIALYGMDRVNAYKLC